MPVKAITFCPWPPEATEDVKRTLLAIGSL